jgi:hypothetical protein
LRLFRLAVRGVAGGRAPRDPLRTLLFSGDGATVEE